MRRADEPSVAVIFQARMASVEIVVENNLQAGSPQPLEALIDKVVELLKGDPNAGTEYPRSILGELIKSVQARQR